MAALCCGTSLSAYHVWRANHGLGNVLTRHVPLRIISTALAAVPGVHQKKDDQRKNLTRRKKDPRFKIPLSPRTERMRPDLNWASVYPSAAVFKPWSVPLPVRMGYPVKLGVPPSKEGNAELLKIPNFLHLTPPAIKKHCAALKQFCTKWPEELDTDEKCEVHFPIEVQSSDYISAGPSIRNPKSRVVTLNIRLSSLNLDDHARKKLIWLVGHRYCKQTDILTIKTDRCPLRKQNYDYTFYLLTVLYHESWKVEPWEASKSREDMEIYRWDGSPSEATLNEIMVNIRQAEHKPALTVDELRTSEEIKSYSESVEMLKNVGETDQNMHNYKEAVLRLFRLQHAA